MKKGICSQTETALHCHDLISFKRCRRKWGFSSPFRSHLQPKSMQFMGADGKLQTNVNQHLWFGSGFHFAMEDYEGYKRFPDAAEAFKAYVEAHTIEERPTNWEELLENGLEMLYFYQDWAKAHTTWKVVQLDGVPLVEQKYSLVMDELSYYEHYTTHERITMKELGTGVLDLDNWMYHEIVVHGTFDAIVEDEFGNWWVLDYKTAAAFDTAKLDLDQQISMYCWAASQWFQRDIAGMVYVQVSKKPPSPPKITKQGVSVAKTQRTTKEMYYETCLEYYGTEDAIPEKNLEFMETLEGYDKFINVQWVERTIEHQQMTYHHIVAQGKEILNSDLYLYPNPTKDCSWDCPFIQVCKAMEEGADYQYLLEEMFEERVETLTDDLRAYEKRLAMQNPDKFPQWYEYVTANFTQIKDEFIPKKKDVDLFAEFK